MGSSASAFSTLLLLQPLLLIVLLCCVLPLCCELFLCILGTAGHYTEAFHLIHPSSQSPHSPRRARSLSQSLSLSAANEASTSISGSNSTSPSTSTMSHTYSQRRRKPKRRPKKKKSAKKMQDDVDVDVDASSSGQEGIVNGYHHLLNRDDVAGVGGTDVVVSGSSAHALGPPPRLTGNIPNIEWRAVPMADLRQHPHFAALPPPREVGPIQALEDVRQFRQDSWQWDALHEGRCTTSVAVAALGFLEVDAAQSLGVPSAWYRGKKQRRATVAFQKLRSHPLRTLRQINDVLCDHDQSDTSGGASGGGGDGSTASESQPSPTLTTTSRHQSDSQENSVWAPPNTASSSSYAARYVPRAMTEQQYAEFKARARKQHTPATHPDRRGATSSKAVRMQWGVAAEPTALLTCLNYFHAIDPAIVLQEVGMCGAGIDLYDEQRAENQGTAASEKATKDRRASSLLIGATPDAVLAYPNGTIEAVEVKNHCPFLETAWYRSTLGGGGGGKKRHAKNKRGAKKVFFIGNRPFQYTPTVYAHYVPQLQLEMLCVGPSCRSVVIVRQTATQGALILRMRRDDDWIDEMLYWLDKFNTIYVETGTPPPPNFFWTDTDETERSRYRRFVNSTARIRNSAVEIVSDVPQENIQRAGGANTPYFLDD